MSRDHLVFSSHTSRLELPVEVGAPELMLWLLLLLPCPGGRADAPPAMWIPVAVAGA